MYKEKSIIDGANKVKSLLITDDMSSNMLSFAKESNKLNKSETHYKGDRLELVNMFLNDLYKLFGAQMSYFRGPG